MKAYWLVPAVIAAGLVLTMVDRKAGLSTWLELRGELETSQARIVAMVEETDALREEIRALETDPFAEERAIREELELALPGELIVRFPQRSRLEDH